MPCEYIYELDDNLIHAHNQIEALEYDIFSTKIFSEHPVSVESLS